MNAWALWTELTDRLRGGKGATDMLSRRRFARGADSDLPTLVACSVFRMDVDCARGRRDCLELLSRSWIFWRCRRSRSLDNVSTVQTESLSSEEPRNTGTYLRANLREHSVHSNGFSLVWLRSCRVRCSRRLNALWQVGQTWIRFRSSFDDPLLTLPLFGGAATSIIEPRGLGISVSGSATAILSGQESSNQTEKWDCWKSWL